MPERFIPQEIIDLKPKAKIRKDEMGGKLTKNQEKITPIPTVSSEDHDRFLREMNELTRPSQNPEGETVTVEFLGKISDAEVEKLGKKGGFIDEIITRGPRSRVSTYVRRTFYNDFDNIPKGPKDVVGYSIAAGDPGNKTDGQTARIYTRDRSLVRKIHDEVVREGGDSRALDRVIDKHSGEMSPDVPGRKLLVWGGEQLDPEEMVK